MIFSLCSYDPRHALFVDQSFGLICRPICRRKSQMSYALFQMNEIDLPLWNEESKCIMAACNKVLEVHYNGDLILHIFFEGYVSLISTSFLFFIVFIIIVFTLFMILQVFVFANLRMHVRPIG